MFEKEAIDSFNGKKVLYKWETDKRSYIGGFSDGAEFGYNKANEWHYVKDGLPKEMQEVIICIKDEKRITRAKRIKNDLWTSPSEDFNTQEIIAWKELPELPKESE